MRKKIQGIGIDLSDSKGALSYVKELLDNGKKAQIVTINPEMVVLASNDTEFKKILNEAELVIPDGIGIKIALKFKGIEQERIRGVDFAYELLKMADKYTFRVAFLGAKDEVIQKTVKNLKTVFKNLNIVYYNNGYFNDEDKVIEEILSKKPQFLLTALGSPKQEFLNYKIKSLLNNCVCIGVGGSFDVWSGNVDAAPIFYQNLGLEWLYRTIKQPERLKRIFPTLPIFLFRSIMDVYRQD